MSRLPRAEVPAQRSLATGFLFGANVLLLVVVWIVSVIAYGRLPQEIPTWLSLWKSGQAWVGKSLAFFIYPASQVVSFVVLLSLARVFFIKAPRPDDGSPPWDTEKAARLLGLKKEVAYLALIFVNLVFIHLQTSLILLAHRVGAGINKYYFLSLFVMIIFIVVPYYRLRRKLIRMDAGDRQD
ncbi:MAG TPA: hypothetical protein P5119_08180 [Candidatus Aminicenantes bacterium]|nr:hypothetical protein [Candidatus Aminicenantes bacterium]HRY65304.1 hypothetical protein [Candidatus Aminicenantes bacterium]HRZ72228.1 hypothetical protein [Candidatus Aminicenantes bacterium]